jgi:hypothetical protein
MQVRRETVKSADRISVSIRTDGDVMDAIADVDPSGVWMHHLQARVIGPELPRQFFPLLPGHS